MKVLQIANDYLGTRLYGNLFSALAEKGIENRVYVPITWNAPAPPACGENVVISRCFSNFDRLMFFPKQWNMLQDIEKRFSPDGFDAVYAHTVFSGGYTAFQLHKLHGLPYIVALRNTDLNVFFKHMVHLRGIGVEIMRHAERVVFLSPSYRSRVLERYVPPRIREELEGKCIVIPNGISSLFFEKKGTARPALSGPPRLLYVGEVSSNKNLETTIQAARQLRQTGLDVRLTVVGAILEEKYRSLMEENADFVAHHDRCPQEEVLTHMRDADIFVMPSHTETFGLVYAEAMSQGLPVLYTRGQGFDRQFLDGTVGYAVSDRDPVELADKIRLAVEHYAALSDNCLRLVEKFDWEKIAAQYVSLYKQIALR